MQDKETQKLANTKKYHFGIGWKSIRLEKSKKILKEASDSGKSLSFVG